MDNQFKRSRMYIVRAETGMYWPSSHLERKIGFDAEYLAFVHVKYSPLSLTQIRGNQANHFELSVVWANQIMTS